MLMKLMTHRKVMQSLTIGMEKKSGKKRRGGLGNCKRSSNPWFEGGFK